MTEKITIRNFDNTLQDYQTIWSAMQNFTDKRTPETKDEIWILEHTPVFTQGQAGKPEHILNNNHNIPIILSDRGGQVTYHGPGQIVIYLLLNLRQLQLSIRQLVTLIETAVINTLQYYHITSYSDPNAPGIYIDLNNRKTKICSIGLRVRRGCTYHGLALNYNMDLLPFSYINPCGFDNLQIANISQLSKTLSRSAIVDKLSAELINLLGYN